MNSSDLELAQKKTIGFIWLVTVCFFNTVPLFIISFLANLSAVCEILLVSLLHDFLTFCLVSDDCVCSIPSILGQLIARHLYHGLRCLTTSCLGLLCILLAHYYAVAHTIYGRTHTFPSGPSCYCPLLCIPSHFAIGNFYGVWRFLQ